MDTVIKINQLTKYYNQRPAVENLNLSVEQGEIFGFVGPNGAGKTSTLRMMAGLLRPTRGDIEILGFSVNNETRQVKKLIGYMPDNFGLYPNLKVWEYMDFFAACYMVSEIQRPGLIDGLLELVDLNHRNNDYVDRLSRGMKQRLSLARTLIHDPQLLILDEPAAGLDPRARIEIRELLVELAGMGKTVFFSTHILSDVSEICTRVGIIEAGKLVAEGAIENLKLQSMPFRSVLIRILGKLDQAKELLENNPKIINIIIENNREKLNQRLRIDFTGNDQDLIELLNSLIHADIPVIHFSENQNDIEQVFLRSTKGLVT